MKLESTLITLAKVAEAKEEMAKETKKFGMDSDDITNTELSCISALLSDIAMSLAMIADHYTDMKKENQNDPDYINEDAKKHFKGKCPYTDKKCEEWKCQDCEVEAAERRYMENDSEE